MKIKDVMLSEEEEQFLPPTTVLQYYKDKTELAVEIVNMLSILAFALLILIFFTWGVLIIS